MMTYRPKGKRSLGRPLKRWIETVTGHWGLIRVRKKIFVIISFQLIIHNYHV
jgi:hypothetical protein